MLWQAIITWASISAIVVTALAVLFTNKRPFFVSYALFSLSLSGWLISQFFINRNIAPELFLGIGFLSVELAVGMFVLFAYASPDKQSLAYKYYPLVFLSFILLGPFSFSSYIGSITDTGAFINGPLYSIQSAFLIGTILIGLVLFGYNYRHSTIQDKRKMRLLTLAFIPFLLASYVTGVLWVDNNNIQFLRPLGALVMIAIIIYTIVRHRLFNIRLVVARALGYAFAMLLLALLYGIVVFAVTRYLFQIKIPLNAQIFFALLTAISSLSFSTLRKWFDKFSNRLFYRDAYDPEKLFGDLNKTLVSSLDTKFLMTQSISIIETAIKPDFAAVGFAGAKGQYRIFSSRKIGFSERTIAYVRKTTPHIHHKVIVADYLDTSHYGELKKQMSDNSVAVLVRLTQDVRKTEEGMGYLILGNKKSGNPYTSQDVQTLETVANELIIAVQNALHYEEIQQFNEVLQSRVDDATRKLRRTNEKLRALDETKDDFISMASHQLRTPLTSVKGYLSMVLEGDAGKLNATQEKMLGQAFVSSQRMVYLIADLLNVSRLRTGKFVIEQAPTDLSHMIEEELSQLVETAKAREITLTYKKPKDFPLLMLDETKTRQVIMNFVDNAIYYTKPNGTIEVKLEATSHSVELRVIDNGIGVPKSEQHHLFTKFYRAGNARKARPDGTGLGLFMAKKVVVAEGGSIIFDSKENKGSTFGFSFPLQKLAVKHAPVVPAPKKAAK